MRLFLLFFMITCVGAAQTIRAQVKIETPNLTATEQEDIRYLSEAIEEYINGYDWANTDIEETITCNISFIIQTVQNISGKNSYSAQFLISSPAQENYYDKNVSFTFKTNERLEHLSSEYQPLANFLDFYIHLVLAGELDTYDEFLGDNQYAKARESLIKAKSSPYGSEWGYREKLILDNTSPLIRTLRSAKLKYYIALNHRDEGAFKEMRHTAQRLMDDVKSAFVNQPNNMMLKQFFKGYYKGIVEILDPKLDSKYFVLLEQMDPERKEFYRNRRSN